MTAEHTYSRTNRNVVNTADMAMGSINELDKGQIEFSLCITTRGLL